MASMSGAPRVLSLNVAPADAEARPVLMPGGNKARSCPANARKPAPKPIRKAAPATVATSERPAVAVAEDKKEVKKNAGGGAAAKGSSPLPSPRGIPPPVQPPRKHDVPPRSLNLSLNVSCSSDTSVESFRSRASTGRIGGVMRPVSRIKPGVPKRGKVVNKDVSEGVVAAAAPTEFVHRRRCAWVTPTTDPWYVTFHDEEWGVPVHDDRRLFELLVLSSALAELTWPEILKRRHICREIFTDFDPFTVSKMNEKKLVAPGSIASSLLSEQKLRAIVENARQILKIVDEFGSFDQYCWSFLNQKPIVSKFRCPNQVPIKSPKADMISKDLVRRGFRSVGPTVIYSFMQAAGLTNDHLVGCFRFEECNASATVCTSETDRIRAQDDLKRDGLTAKISSKNITRAAALSRAIDTLM